MSSKMSKSKSFESNSITTDKYKKLRTSRVSIADVPSSTGIENKNVGPHLLSSDYIILRGESGDKLFTAEKNLIVPPSSPKSSFIYDKTIDTITDKIIDVSNLKIPYVRVLGIKNTIDILGEFFGCTIYKTSLPQFWFLDMVTDCLWKCQDEFMLNEEYQKSVLKWVLFLFDIIRDPLLNLSRGQFFRLFREILTLAENRIECGDSYFPKPEELFDFKDPPEDAVEFEAMMSDSTDSSLSFDDSDSQRSYLVMQSEEYPELPDFYKLPAKDCECDLSLTSSLETLSENSLPISKDPESQESFHFNSEVELNNLDTTYSVSEFYKPDIRIHSRFIDELDEEDEESIDEEMIQDDTSSDLEYEWVTENGKPSEKSEDKPKSTATISSHDASSVHSTMRKIRSSSTKGKIKQDRKSTQEESGSSQSLKKPKVKVSKQEEKLGEENMLKAWFQYNMWEQRKEMMADPSKGWKPFEPELCADDCICDHIEYSAEDFTNDEYLQIKNEWMQYLEKHKMAIDQTTHNFFVNSCLLLIVKQFVFEYFYESFQYKLIKMAYQTVPTLTYEKLNTKWSIPKENKEDLKRPVEKKPKPPKPVKEKSPKTKDKKKKEKDDKKSKSSKGSSKKERAPKVKPEKAHKPTKEEKEELERLKREEEERIQNEIAAAENRRFIFPLGLATNEDFFKNIFLNYVPPSETKDKSKDTKKKKK